MKFTKHVIALICLSAVFFLGCKKSLIEKLTEDVYFNFNANSYLKNQVQFQFINANFKTSTVTPKVKLTILEDSRNLVYDINGGRDIAVDGQFAILAVSPGKTIPESSPVKFYVRAEAPGFLPVQREIEVRENDAFQHFIFEMPELAKLPQGFSMNKQEQMEVVQMDPAAEPVAANLSYLITRHTNKISVNGNIEETAFFPIQYAIVQHQKGNNEKGDFAITMEAGTKDRLTGQPLKAGDVVQAFRKDLQSDSWIFEKDITLTAASNGKLKATLQAARPGEFAFSASATNRPVASCRGNFSIRFTRPTPVSTLHYVEVVSGTGPNPAILLSASNVDIRQNSKLDFTGKLPSGATNIRVRVFEYETKSLSSVIVADVPVTGNVCDWTSTNPFTVAVNPPSITGNPVFQFELDTYCTNTVYYHEGRTLFRKKGVGPYLDLGFASRSSAVTNAVETNVNINPSALSIDNKFSQLYTDRLRRDWNQVYEFRTTITSKVNKSGKAITRSYTRERKLVQSEYAATAASATYPGGLLKFSRGFWFAPASVCADFGY